MNTLKMFQDKHESDLICQNARWIMDNSDLTNGNLITDITVLTAGLKYP